MRGGGGAVIKYSNNGVRLYNWDLWCTWNFRFDKYISGAGTVSWELGNDNINLSLNVMRMLQGNSDDKTIMGFISNISDWNGQQSKIASAAIIKLHLKYQTANCCSRCDLVIGFHHPKNQKWFLPFESLNYTGCVAVYCVPLFCGGFKCSCS